MFTDYHVHTYYSLDSKYPMADVVRDAINMGIKELCFTDHVDYGPVRDFDDPRGIETLGDIVLLNTHYPNYFKEISELRNKYDGQIIIKQGLEFGIQKETIEDYEKLFNKYPLDFVILSIHDIDNKTLAQFEWQEGLDPLEYHRMYYQIILDIIKKFKNYSVLGHLDYINRYDKCEPIPLEKDKEYIIEVLKQVIKDGKGIEVNTSSYRYGMGEWTPRLEILKMYKDLGGRVLTFGSDSHKPEHLGGHIQEKMEILKDIGFKEYCTFDRMKPTFHEL